MSQNQIIYQIIEYLQSIKSGSGESIDAITTLLETEFSLSLINSSLLAVDMLRNLKLSAVVHKAVSGIRFKSFPAFEKPTLLGSVLRPRLVLNAQMALSSSGDNPTKRFLGDESSLAVLSTAEKLAKKLDQNEINYALVGGFALNVHGFKRQTTDVDVLMSASDLEKFKSKIVHNGFAPRFRDAKKSFRDPVSNVGVDVIVAGEYPGSGAPSAMAYPEPSDQNVMVIGGLRVISLDTLVNLKLASYKSLPQNRMKDRTDVYGLVKNLSMGESFADRLDASVRDEYLKVVAEVVEEEKQGE